MLTDEVHVYINVHFFKDIHTDSVIMSGLFSTVSKRKRCAPTRYDFDDEGMLIMCKNVFFIVTYYVHCIVYWSFAI